MRLLLILAIFLFPLSAAAQEWRDSPTIQHLFRNANGTFVLYDVGAQVFIGHDQTRAHMRFFPASTFKIPNSLIGLTVGAVKNVDEVLPYGGQPQPIKQWEQDMGLREAIQISNVPVYQELARRIGVTRMREAVEQLHFGNAQIGEQVDQFWLYGPLQISAIEQTRFLARLAQETLPFPVAAQRQVKAITLLEAGDGWSLHGKTGWATAATPQVGWWVGWVEKQGRIYTFALNMDLTSSDDLPKRLELGKASLKALGILPAEH